MVLSNFDRKMYDKICNHNFILIYDNNFLLLFSESLDSKARKMLQPSSKKQKTHSTQIAVSTTISTSTFEMIRKYNTFNNYAFVDDWYVQIETPMNMFPDMYLSIDGKDPDVLGIIENCYVHNESHIDF
jgi:hypothetical protein